MEATDRRGARPHLIPIARTGGGIARVSPGSAVARLETFDADGRIVSTVDLEPASQFTVLPDGSLLVTGGFDVNDSGQLGAVVIVPAI